ncbi:abc transporter [Pyrenophora seminiperda CCB06]|uniref:Abc transporter n=1 Tax=Pyrenophora seminiperda CCB06 TaxID=1302712 RepID=A0A3M7MHE8_9PLEO|nr:abc transporter [Pyrenophora seminiperda CCB06]
MTATAQATADRRIVHLILHHLSEMKYKDRRQRGPDQPVEFLAFRPTLAPSILVNKLWADEGTSILWNSYPHLPALQDMPIGRRQWYATKAEKLFVLDPAESDGGMAYLEGLDWPNLKTLELEVDWQRHEKAFRSMLHARLQDLELHGIQPGGSQYIAEHILPALSASCTNLRSICFGPDLVKHEDPVHDQKLIHLLDCIPSIIDVQINNAGFSSKDTLFKNLSQRPGLETLHIDLDPGLQLLSSFTGHNALSSPFSSLKRLHIKCYPEIALALAPHLQLVEEVLLDIARIPHHDQQINDVNVLDDILGAFSRCTDLQSLQVNIGQLSRDFPSVVSHPVLSGIALVKLATGCSKLRDINLVASEPSSINGSMISKLQFEAFTRKLPQLVSLTLKLHPQTAIRLESTALGSLGRNCPLLTILRLKVALHLPDLQSPGDPLSAQPVEPTLPNASEDDNMPRRPSIAINGHQRGPSLDFEQLVESRTPTGPLFANLTYLAFARPQSILSIASDTYTVSSNSQSSSAFDPLLEEDLVRSWARPLAVHFPRLEVLETWGDWAGQDNESLNYFLPREELLASTWEFLSGVEQDLWEDDGDEDELDELNWVEPSTERYSIVSADWDLASFVNEFPDVNDVGTGAYLEPYEEEPEGMITPGRTIGNEEEAYFRGADAKSVTASGPAALAVASTSISH